MNTSKKTKKKQPLAPKAQGTFLEREWKDYKSQKMRKFAVSVSPNNVRSYAQRVST